MVDKKLRGLIKGELEDTVNEVIRRDVKEATGFDGLDASESIIATADKEGFLVLIPENQQYVLEIIAENLKKVYEKHFIGKEEEEIPAINFYSYINEKGDLILEELAERFGEEDLNDHYCNYLKDTFKKWFRDLPKKLLHIGNIHKFNLNFVEKIIFPEEEFNKTIFLDDSPDRSVPDGPKHNIYLITKIEGDLFNLEPGEFPKNSFKNLSTIQELVNLPGILMGSFKKIGVNSDNKVFIEKDGVLDFSLLQKNSCERLFYDLNEIYKLMRLPVLLYDKDSFDWTGIIREWEGLDPAIEFRFYIDENNNKSLCCFVKSPKYRFVCELKDIEFYETPQTNKIVDLIKNHRSQQFLDEMCKVRIENEQIHYTNLEDGKEKIYSYPEYIKHLEKQIEIMRQLEDDLEKIHNPETEKQDS